MKVWMRGRAACFTASPARSMSSSPARDRPHTTERLRRLAISETASKSPSRGDREAGLDDVDAHGVEEVGDLQLLLEGHGGAGALLAVAQRGVEDEDAVGVGGLVRLLRLPLAGAGLLASVMVGGPRLRPGRCYRGRHE